VIKKINQQPGFAIFVLLFTVACIIGLFFTFIFSKTDLHATLNTYHSGFFDLFFQGITLLGDGIFAVLLSIVFFFMRNRKEGVLLLITFIISALIAQFFKNFVFYDEMRPLFFIQAGELNVQTVEGIKMHMNHSFPSGHTTTIFAMCSMLSLFFKTKRMGLILFLIAILTAYSRIYLSQHFLQDTLAGSFIGLTTSVLLYSVSNEKLRLNSNNSTEM
jgi:membrane-associated phospholipid phosphatase